MAGIHEPGVEGSELAGSDGLDDRQAEFLQARAIGRGDGGIAGVEVDAGCEGLPYRCGMVTYALPGPVHHGAAGVDGRTTGEGLNALQGDEDDVQVELITALPHGAPPTVVDGGPARHRGDPGEDGLQDGTGRPRVAAGLSQHGRHERRRLHVTAVATLHHRRRSGEAGKDGVAMGPPGQGGRRVAASSGMRPVVLQQSE